MMLVKDIMTANPFTINPDATIMEAEKILSINKIGRLLVVDNGDLVGMLTDGDIISEKDLQAPVEDFMSEDLIIINEKKTVQDAAKKISDNHIGGLPVFNDKQELVGIVTSEDIVYGYLKDEEAEMEIEKKTITPESSAIYLSMTRSRDYEEYWLKKIQGYGYRGAITQTGASAEKLPIKLRESTTVAAIARGVINENAREKMAISNAVKDAYSQLALVNPGLGGGFKIAVVRGEGHVSVAIFGKFGHALVDGPEHLTVGTSVI
ncbi:CBS domain-containing protein [Halanaerobium sp. Z-7514]|uniref:Hut operon positive regulatory protein n=1 Tax=Halanaerobium polyolivorans TaxID=2886943 RepID=A0AAW4WVH8_9FIRM|nr:HutP family protein [Halanaerobium polyolivorans]MCC3145105.1 CBS domain-containing protein [Halanaerobium polyolivorans]